MNKLDARYLSDHYIQTQGGSAAAQILSNITTKNAEQKVEELRKADPTWSYTLQNGILIIHDAYGELVGRISLLSNSDYNIKRTKGDREMQKQSQVNTHTIGGINPTALISQRQRELIECERAARKAERCGQPTPLTSPLDYRWSGATYFEQHRAELDAIKSAAIAGVYAGPNGYPGAYLKRAVRFVLGFESMPESDGTRQTADCISTVVRFWKALVGSPNTAGLLSALAEEYCQGYCD